MEELNWSWPIPIYLWAAGVGGGAFFTAFIIDRLTGGQNRTLLKLATWIGAPLVIIGVMLLLVDLGQPLRFWHLFLKFDVMTPMSLGTWILTLWSMCAVAMLTLWVAEYLKIEFLIAIAPLTVPLSWIAFILAILMIAYTGVLLSTTSVALWYGAAVLLPILFVVSAISTGAAALILGGSMMSASSVSREVLHRLGIADIGVIVWEAVVLAVWILWLSFGSTTAASEAVRQLLSHWTLAVPFWLGVIGLALLVPLLLENRATLTRSTALASIASVCVLVGGLVLRFVVVYAGQL